MTDAFVATIIATFGPLPRRRSRKFNSQHKGEFHG